MNHLPNILSALRFPLALLFLQEGILCRATAIVLAMASDVLDGFIARKFKISSRLGATLDPLADKFFVMFILAVLISEGRLTAYETIAFLCRDIAVAVFGCYLVLTGKLAHYKFRAIYCGKITTSLQFIIMLGLTFHVAIPAYFYDIFIVLGLAALVELYVNRGKVIA